MSDNNDKNKKTGLIVFFVVIGLAIVYAIVSAIIANKSFDSDYRVWQPSSSQSSNSNFVFTPFSTQSKKDIGPKIPKKSKYIAKLYITGTIEPEGMTYNQEWLLESIDMLKEDENNVGILLVIDSPGGTVYEADGAYLALRDYREETGHPIYAYMQSMAASGGYYIACAADYIIANRNTLTGSIGVIAGGFIDVTELLKKYGIKYETVHAGKNKNMGNYNEPITQEQLDIMQSIADECYDQFVGIVADSRNMSVNDVKKLADGRIYTALQAKQNGLIDSIVLQDKEVIPLMEEAEFPDEDYEDFEEVDFKYEESASFYDLFMEAASKVTSLQSSANTALPQIVEETLEKTANGPAYLYLGM